MRIFTPTIQNCPPNENCAILGPFSQLSSRYFRANDKGNWPDVNYLFKRGKDV